MLSAADVEGFRKRLTDWECAVAMGGVCDGSATHGALEQLRVSLCATLERLSDPDERGALRGWLLKRKRKDGISRWKRRYCVLRVDGLHYHEAPMAAELGCMEVHTLQAVEWADAVARDTLVVVLSQSVTYELRVSPDGGASISEWRARLSAMKPDGFSLVNGLVLRQGTLYKQREMGVAPSVKRRRYVVLHEYTILFYDQKVRKANACARFQFCCLR